MSENVNVTISYIRATDLFFQTLNSLSLIYNIVHISFEKYN